MSETATVWSTHRVYPPEAIELRIGADATHLPVIRSVAASIATQADFDVDTIADLRLAVDEVCTTLIDSAVPLATLVCRFSVDDGAVLRFDGSVPSVKPDPPSTRGFGWQVLNTLTSSAATWLDPDESHDATWLHIEIAKNKAEIDV